MRVILSSTPRGCLRIRLAVFDRVDVALSAGGVLWLHAGHRDAGGGIAEIWRRADPEEALDVIPTLRRVVGSPDRLQRLARSERRYGRSPTLSR